MNITCFIRLKPLVLPRRACSPDHQLTLSRGDLLFKLQQIGRTTEKSLIQSV